MYLYFNVTLRLTFAVLRLIFSRDSHNFYVHSLSYHIIYMPSPVMSSTFYYRKDNSWLAVQLRSSLYSILNCAFLCFSRRRIFLHNLVTDCFHVCFSRLILTFKLRLLKPPKRILRILPLHIFPCILIRYIDWRQKPWADIRKPGGSAGNATIRGESKCVPPSAVLLFVAIVCLFEAYFTFHTDWDLMFRKVNVIVIALN
jgi:hypothetical protein